MIPKDYQSIFRHLQLTLCTCDVFVSIRCSPIQLQDIWLHCPTCYKDMRVLIILTSGCYYLWHEFSYILFFLPWHQFLTVCSFIYLFGNFFFFFFAFFIVTYTKTSVSSLSSQMKYETVVRNPFCPLSCN